MEIGDWITLAAVIVALGIGVASILHTQSLQKKERKERLLNEIVEWVSEVKRKAVPTDIDQVLLAGKREYEFISISLADVMLKAELMKLRAKENAIPILNELDNVWQSAFFCAQLASRILGNTPTVQQRERWSRAALDVITRIDQLEEQGNLTDQEMYEGQKDLLEKISICLKKLVKVEASL